MVCPEGFVAIQGTARLFLLQNGSVVGPELSTGTLSRQDFNWIVSDFEKAMEGGKDYEVLLAGKIRTQASTIDFEQRFRFTTKAAATLSLPKAVAPTSYFYGSELWISSSIELDQSLPATLAIESEDAPGMYLPHTAAFAMDRSSPGSFDPVGTARLTFRDFDAPKQLNSRFRSSGLRDIFMQPIPIKTKKRLAPPSSPKAKDDSYFYAKILHQAGVHSRPAWILDGKLAPVFALRGLANWQLRPSAESDIGEGGAVGKSKTNDYIKVGLGIGKFVRTEHLGPIQGVDPSFGAAYETNYAGAKKNFLFVPDARFYLAGSDHSLKQQNFIRFVHESTCNPLPLGVTEAECKRNAPVEPQDATKAFFGYKLRTFAGLELGTQISDQTAKASEGDSKVTVPGYRIARVRPKVDLDLEFGRITLTLSGTPRYLATTENVYRERDTVLADGKTGKQVYIDRVAGWRPSGEAGLSIALDDAGHYALSSSLKVGSLPPNFQRVTVVQSGFTIKF